MREKPTPFRRPTPPRPDGVKTVGGRVSYPESMCALQCDPEHLVYLKTQTVAYIEQLRDDVEGWRRKATEAEARIGAFQEFIMGPELDMPDLVVTDDDREKAYTGWQDEGRRTNLDHIEVKARTSKTFARERQFLEMLKKITEFTI